MSAPINCRRSACLPVSLSACLPHSSCPLLICAVRQQEVPLTNWLQPCPGPVKSRADIIMTESLMRCPTHLSALPLPTACLHSAPNLSPFFSVSPFTLLAPPSAAAVILALALIDASFCCVYLLFARRTHKSHALRSFLGVLRACDLHLVLLVARFVCMRFPGIFTVK